MDRHWVAVYVYSKDLSRKGEGGEPILVDMFPRPKGDLRRAYDVLSNRTLVRRESRTEKALKAHVGAALGHVINYNGGFGNNFWFPEPYVEQKGIAGYYPR